jgi:hypothetical protein
MKIISYQKEHPNKNMEHLNNVFILDNNPNRGFDSYLSAMAWNSGCWEDYCEFYRKNYNKDGKYDYSESKQR